MKESWARLWATAFIVASLVLVGLVAGCGTSGDEGDTELADKQGQEQEDVAEPERELALEDLPEAVRVTILGAAGTNTILEIEEVRVGDRLTYEAEWLEDGMEIEIEVAPDGELLEREVKAPDDDSEDEDDEDED